MPASKIDRSTIACPVELTMSLISNKWKTLIIRNLLSGRKRFSELSKGLPGISQKVLTANLRELERDGLVLRTVYPEVPPRVEYELTEIGMSLKQIIEVMLVWGCSYQQK
ncbi:MAG: helix-turn-helix transcriptional regulator, partial [Proteobacteria bacterium]|nr:helix-turn-helix transcriptional regulator [Candidatus Avisuccinivibrio stercorigallinarum]